MATPEQSGGQDLTELKESFFLQALHIHDGQPGDVAERKAAMHRYLPLIANAIWTDRADSLRAHIFVAPEGSALVPKVESRQSTRRFSDPETHTTEPGGRWLKWLIRFTDGLSGDPVVIFQDALTGEVGEQAWHDNETTFDFKEDEGLVLATCETKLGDIFFPHSATVWHPADPTDGFDIVDLPR